jgi:hypothetical protein
VSGPLANLTVKAGGAFAAYLIVFVVVIPFVNQAHNAVGGLLRPAWTFTGRLHFIDKKGADWNPSNEVFQKVGVRLQPELNFVNQTFSITIPEGPHGIPTIYLVTGISPDVEIEWDQDKDKVDWFGKTIKIKKPIVVKEKAVNDSDDRTLQTVRPQ